MTGLMLTGKELEESMKDKLRWFVAARRWNLGAIPWKLWGIWSVILDLCFIKFTVIDIENGLEAQDTGCSGKRALWVYTEILSLV